MQIYKRIDSYWLNKHVKVKEYLKCLTFRKIPLAKKLDWLINKKQMVVIAKLD